jgi:hypothetical protein
MTAKVALVPWSAAHLSGTAKRKGKMTANTNDHSTEMK